jgi:hypothetical protein
MRPVPVCLLGMAVSVIAVISQHRGGGDAPAEAPPGAAMAG